MSKAVAAAYRAGQDGEQTYRSMMNMRCSQRQRIADAQERANADADCTAFFNVYPTPAASR